MHFLPFALLLAIGPLVHSRPSRGVRVDDVIYSPEQLQFFEGHKASRTAITWSKFYWKDSTLVYSFGDGIDIEDMALIESAMEEISSSTCVKFRRAYRDWEPKVLIARLEETCYAEAGYQNKQSQQLNLGSECMTRDTIQHELLHALGLHHTHQHPDRDQFVEIKFENIQPDLMYNFDKLENVTNFGLGYDYASLMHYDERAYSKNGERTIIPLQANVTISWPTRMSPLDVALLNCIYCLPSCPSKLPL